MLHILQPGLYRVILRVTDDNGATSSISKVIQIYTPPSTTTPPLTLSLIITVFIAILAGATYILRRR